MRGVSHPIAPPLPVAGPLALSLSKGPPPPATPASPSPARVIPAKAGIQRGEARGVSHPIAPPLPVVDTPPAPVRPEPVEACPEGTRRGSPTTTSPRITLPRTRHSCEGRNPEGRRAGRLHPPSHPPLPTKGAPPKSVRPEPVEACPEGTRRGPTPTDSPRITPSPPPPREPHPLAPDGTLTRPYCPHSSASVTVSPWQSQSPTATRTPRVPMPSGAPARSLARSLAAWSASVVRDGSSSIRRGCLYSAKKFLDL